jgi:hypothetical protein
MDECRATSHLIDSLEVDDQLTGIFACVRHYLRGEQGDYMVGDDLLGFILKIRVVDPQIGVEPVDFIFDEFLRHEPLLTS